MWGLRAENADISIPIARKLADEIHRAAGDVVAGDCHLANTAINEQIGEEPLHPLQLIARAYGTVSYTHLRAHETPEQLVCRLLLETKNDNT